MSATAPATRAPSATPAPEAAVEARADLRQVPKPAATVAGTGMFAFIVLALLTGGMALLLALNTSLAQGAFEISGLLGTQHDLAITEQGLMQYVTAAESPERLEVRARALGMVPAETPVFIRLADGAILGTPSAAKPATRSSRSSSSRATKPAAKPRVSTASHSTPVATSHSSLPATVPAGSGAVTHSGSTTSDGATIDAPTKGSIG